MYYRKSWIYWFLFAFTCSLATSSQSVAQYMVDPNGVTIIAGASNSAPTIRDDGNVNYLLVLLNEAENKSLELAAYQNKKVADSVRQLGITNFQANQARYASNNSQLSGTEYEKLHSQYLLGIVQRNNEFNQGVEDTLLPHQLMDLKRKAFTSQLSNFNIENAIGFSDPKRQSTIDKLLSLTPEEKNALVPKAMEIQAELQAKIAKLKSEATLKLLKEFPQSKKAMIKKMYGVDLATEKAKNDTSSKDKK